MTVLSSSLTSTLLLNNYLVYKNVNSKKNKNYSSNSSSIFSNSKSKANKTTDSVFFNSDRINSELEANATNSEIETNKTSSSEANKQVVTIKQKTVSDIEKEYLSANPDVALAVAKGAFKSALDHYVKYGKAEGRAYDIKNLNFNEKEYLSANPDVALAVAKGAIPNALTHYMRYGIKEGRKLK